MTQSNVVGKRQKNGKNFPIGNVPPIPVSSGSSRAPFVGSGATTTTSNVEGKINLERQKSLESKYPLWEYVTRDQGLGSKLKGGGNVLWTCSYCNNQFKATYFCVKHICWAHQVVGLEHVQICLWLRGKKWKKRSMLVWQGWLHLLKKQE